jgi:hypothetical protein
VANLRDRLQSRGVLAYPSGGYPQPDQLVPDQFGSFRVHPSHHQVGVGVSVRVLNRQGGLAYPTPTVQRLHHHRPAAIPQPVPEVGCLDR